MLPKFIEEGFHRHDDDLIIDDPLTLPPKVGQSVKIQVNLAYPLDSDIEEPITWAILGGKVNSTKGLTATAIVRLSTDPVANELLGTWLAELRYDEEFSNPWVLDALSAHMPN